MNNIKLTSYSSGAGWACKINPKDLGKILEKLNKNNLELPKNVVGYGSSDDCSIYPIDNNNLLIQSLDFFTPIVDDPYDFGRIAAANSLSDIYAMGGKPIFALNVTCFPTDDLPLEVLHEILRGGSDIAKQAGIPILGGHSIKDKEPKYGLVVSGIVNKKQIIRNNNAQINDNLILTKPIGTGIISTAIKKQVASKNDIKNIVDIMTDLNSKGSKAMNQTIINACTDITGYGLLGHLKEMCESSKVQANINFEKIPLIENTMNFAKENIIPGGTKRNFEYLNDFLNFKTKIPKFKKLIMSDAQTSGGLLISVSKENTDCLIDALNKQKCLSSSIIGNISKKESNYLINIVWKIF